MNVNGALDFGNNISVVRGVIGLDCDRHCISGNYINVGFRSPLVSKLWAIFHGLS